MEIYQSFISRSYSHLGLGSTILQCPDCTVEHVKLENHEVKGIVKTSKNLNFLDGVIQKAADYLNHL